MKTTNLNEEPVQNYSEAIVPEQSTNASTILNNETDTCEIVSEQHDEDPKNLKTPKATKQTSLDKFVIQSSKTEKRKNSQDSSPEIMSAPSKKQSTSRRINRDNKKVFHFSSTKILFPKETSDDMETETVAPVDEIRNPSEQQTAQITISESTDENKTVQQKPPPPIVIKTGGGNEIRQLTNKINNQPRSFLINIKKDDIKTKIVTATNWSDYEKFIVLLKEKQHHFHTFSSQEPQIKIVLYGLPAMEISEVQEELQAVNILPARIIKMRMRPKRHKDDDDQNYLLYFKKSKEQNVDFLKNLQKIKRVACFKVRWSNYKNKQNGPTQCSRCLQFGHGQRGCQHPSICFRCAEKHEANSCPHLSAEDKKVPLSKLKCHFCSEKHTAISPACKIRLQIIEKWIEKSKSKQANNQYIEKPVVRHQTNRSAPCTSQCSQKAPQATTTSNRYSWRNPDIPPVNAKPQSTKPTPANKSAPQVNQNNANKQNNHVNNKQRKQQNAKPVAKDVKPKDIQRSNNIEVDLQPSCSKITRKQAMRPSEASVVSTNSQERDSEFADLLKMIMKCILNNPVYLEQLKQAIGTIATNNTINNGL